MDTHTIPNATRSTLPVLNPSDPISMIRESAAYLNGMLESGELRRLPDATRYRLRHMHFLVESGLEWIAEDRVVTPRRPRLTPEVPASVPAPGIFRQIWNAVTRMWK
ncbi:MAG: hypothetical protein NTX56_04250 [Proteobacteria bacterium]|nr:hypothetical protein [Pseudomonadota bacterium]